MLPQQDWYNTVASFQLPSSLEVSQTQESEERALCTISEEGMVEEILEDPDDPLPLPALPSPSPSQDTRSSLSLLSTPTASPGSSNASLTTKPVSATPRKRQRAGNDVVNAKLGNTLNLIDTFVNKQQPQRSHTVHNTVSVIAAYMSALVPERQKDVAAKLLNVIHSEPPLSADDLV
ncbi:hypothetical protein Pmani_009727 [Petrolisthes manimaculis]|uniref:Uncharacterized protein n=2 Tax=Petrolisthes manimaculis TaxID=1843537 RepID=A0AAE1UI39_9EUCA|nr:hypothetical protein Pmani_010611 [Petrolisthes manimaculis]KAK4319324.1 hypothetical protein Pmani_009727 [Petrolisthes manimaculis]